MKKIGYEYAHVVFFPNLLLQSIYDICNGGRYRKI
jgi:hypothetical protein